MPGHILIIDSIATNRIVLKVKLSGAFFGIKQAASAQDALQLIAENPPDLVLLGGDLVDMVTLDFCRNLKQCDATAQIPVVMILTDGTRGARLAALRAGADDALAKPVRDEVLLARIHSLLRARDTVEELRLRETTARIPGLAETSAAFDTPSSVMFASQNPRQGFEWLNRMKSIVPYVMRHHRLRDAMRDMSHYPAPDALVVALDSEAPEDGLRFLTEVRSRATTRQTAILVVLDQPSDLARINALDLGANDVMTEGFDAEEVALRLATIIQRKRLTDRLRRSVEAGLNAAVTDPLTGLYNRRYALPQLDRIARRSEHIRDDFAVMVADLDHFKSVNDCYGHAAGDIVLAEIARRMRAALTEADLIARIGGEEFLVVLQTADQHSAATVAKRLCEVVRSEPIYLRGRDIQIPVTISIGVAMGRSLPKPRYADDRGALATPTQDNSAWHLIDLADQALYGAKAEGRDQFTLSRPAA